MLCLLCQLEEEDDEEDVGIRREGPMIHIIQLLLRTEIKQRREANTYETKENNHKGISVRRFVCALLDLFLPECSDDSHSYLLPCKAGKEERQAQASRSDRKATSEGEAKMKQKQG